MSRPKPKSRAAEAAEYLRQEARDRGPGSRLPTLRELSAALGFSQASLSAALTQLEAEGIIVRRRGSGIYASTRLPSCRLTVAIASEFLTRPHQSPFWNLALGSLMKLAAERGWETSCYVGPADSQNVGAESPAPWEREAAKGGTQGIISLGLEVERLKAAQKLGIKVISYAGYGQVMVSRDFAAMTQQGIDAIAEIGEGPIFVGPCEAYSQQRAMEGIRASTRPDALPIFLSPEVENSIQGGQTHQWTKGVQDPLSAAGHWLEQEAPPFPFRLVSLDDMFTKGVILALERKGARVGQQVIIASHSNKGSEALQPWEGALTLMEIDPDQVCRRILDLFSAASELGGWSQITKIHQPDLRLPTGELVYWVPFLVKHRSLTSGIEPPAALDE